MMKRAAVLCSVVIVFLFPTIALANSASVTGSGLTNEILVRWRFSINPVMSFYKNNLDYTANTQALIGFGLGAKTELSFKTNKRAKIITGLEYFNQALQFNTYYFAPGHSVRYDKQFNYKHTLRFQEIKLPILFKQCFNNEDDNFYSGYLMVGWALRYMFTANAAIASAQTGAVYWKGKSGLYIEHPLFYKKLSTALLLGAGFEQKMGDYNRSVFFEACYHYNLFRLHYMGNQSNSIFFRNNMLTLGIGYKFGAN